MSDGDSVYQRGLEYYYKENNIADAERCLLAATKLGKIEAYTSLGMLYQESDFPKALNYYKLGAELNNPDCLYFLADAYGTGKNVEKNEIIAYNLMQKAIANGCIVPDFVLDSYKKAAEATGKSWWKRIFEK